MSSEDETSQSAPLGSVEITVPMVASNNAMVLWEQASTIATPNGTILTLFHNFPVYGEDGQQVTDVTRQPVAFYFLPGDGIISTAAMFVRQALVQVGESDGADRLAEVEETILRAIEEGKSRLEARASVQEESNEPSED